MRLVARRIAASRQIHKLRHAIPPVPSTSRIPYSRPLHTSAPVRLLPFFGLGSRDTVQKQAELFRTATQDRDAEGVCTAYASIRKQLLESEDNVTLRSRFARPAADQPILTYEDLFAALKFLSQTTHIHADYTTLDLLFHDLRTLWKMPYHQRKDHHFYIVGLVNAGRAVKAEQWLDGMLASSTRPRSADWNVYLKGLLHLPAVVNPTSTQARGGGYSKMKAVVLEKMDSEDRDVTTWNTLLAALFKCTTFQDASSKMAKEAKWLRSRLRQDGVQEDLVTLSTLLNGFSDLLQWDLAQEARAELTAHGELDVHAWNSLAKHDILSHSLDKGLATITTMKEAGVSPNKITLETVLKAAAEGQLLDSVDATRALIGQLEQITGTVIDHQGYTALLENASTFEEAAELYGDAQRDGVSSSSKMLRALIRLFPDTGSSAADIDTIKAAYSDLIASKLSQEGRSPLGIFNADLYADLLLFCAHPDVRDFRWAIQLLEEVRNNGLSFFNSDFTNVQPTTHINLRTLPARIPASYIVTSLMKGATTNHSQAFKIYSWMWAIDPERIFSRSDWYDMISTFSTLEFPPLEEGKRSYVPQKVFFAFFEDMRSVGVPPYSGVYQAVLRYYAREGRVPSARANQEAVRQIHDLIKMDQHTATPDIGLMNRLMFAYAKTGNIDGTFNVWRSVLVNRIAPNNTSISIVLDAYGFAGPRAHDALVELWQRMDMRAAPRLNAKNLDSYLEALGRMGKQADVAGVLFYYLEKQAEPDFYALKQQDPDGFQPQNYPTRKKGHGIEVGPHTVEVALKFIRSDGDLYHRTCQRLEAEYPQLWEQTRQVASSLPAAARAIEDTSE